jgi:hemerythrin
LIQWKEEYRVGIKTIDEQHEKLFEIANRAYSLLKNDMVVDKYDQIVAIIQELKDYTVYHFTFEESYMASIHYKKLLSHKVLHDDFIETINRIDLYTIDEHQEQAILDVLNFVADWIADHILVQDQRYVSA